MTKKFQKALFIAVVTLLALNCQADENSWVSCYNKKENRIYFTPYSKTSIQKKSAPKQCRSQTYFEGSKNFSLIEDSLDSKGFPSGDPGAEQIMRLDNGRQIMVSQWNDLSKSNRLLVLEPNFKTNQVKKLCQFENFSSGFSTRVNLENNKIQVYLREPVSTFSNKFQKVWKNCSGAN